LSGSLLERLQRMPRPAVLLLGIALTAVIAWLDAATGAKVALNVFYLVPVMLVAWATASTGYGLLTVLATFLVGPLEAYRNGYAFFSLPVALWNAGMRTAVFCIVLLLLAELRRLVARLREQSLTDELTGVANRRAFTLIAGREIERSRRYAHQLSLAYLDIDGFKAVNDRHGHAAGDRVLIALAGAASATARSVDTVARLGGDEFVVLMPETDENAALPLADRLREASSRAASAGVEPITCSVGVVTYERPPKDVEGLLASADALMYEAKATGGDDVRQAYLAAREIPASGAPGLNRSS
jgi:diguanylate cyclase (GGDEF)-like protein